MQEKHLINSFVTYFIFCGLYRFQEDFAPKDIYILSYLLHGFVCPAPRVVGDVLQLDSILISVNRCGNEHGTD